MTYSTKYYTLVIAFCCVNLTLGNLKAYFPLSDSTNFPRLVFGTLPTLHEYTFCAWIRPHRLNVEYPYIFSYATERKYNALTVLLEKKEDSILGYVQMGDPFVSFNCPSAEWKVGSWQHVCASWLGANGNTKFYVNGYRCPATGSSLILPSGRVLSGGLALLGQDQDEIGGKFEPHQSWYGDIAGANLWNEALEDIEIKKISRCDGIGREGNIIAWSKTAMSAYDGVVFSETKLCDP